MPGESEFRILTARLTVQRMFGEMQLAERVGFEIAVRWCLVKGMCFQSGPMGSSWVVIWPVLPECLLLYSARQRSRVLPWAAYQWGRELDGVQFSASNCTRCTLLISSGHPFGRIVPARSVLSIS